MKYRTLVAALALALGGAITSAAADNAPQDPYQQGSAGASAGSTGAGASAGASAGKTGTTGTATTGTTTGLPEDASQITAVDLLFDTDSSTLKPGARDELVSAAQWAKCHDKGVLILEGHADKRGTQNHNMRLSADRAAMVRQKLVDMGVPSEHIVITVYGENGPRRGSLAQDRRVTVRAAAKPLRPEDVTASR
jgi:outer membrane protein OmpA-like peptidoglycan-associated protein